MVIGEVIVAFVKNALCSLCTEVYVNGPPPTFQLQNRVAKNAWSEGLTHSSMTKVRIFSCAKVGIDGACC